MEPDHALRAAVESVEVGVATGGVPEPPALLNGASGGGVAIVSHVSGGEPGVVGKGEVVVY